MIEKGVAGKQNLIQNKKIVAWTKESPKKIELVKEKIKEEWGVEVSKDTIKRILKNSNMSADQKARGARPYGISRKKERIREVKKTRRSRRN